MRISSQLCLAVSWLGILITAEPAYPQRSEEAEQQRVSKEENEHSEDKTAEESRQRYSIESDGFDTRVPSEFNLEISNLRIPVAEDLPRRIEGSNEEGGGEEPPPNEEEEEDNNRSYGGDADLEEEGGEGRGDDRTGEEEVDEGRAGGSPDYDEYDSPPRNDIPYNSEESGSYEKPGPDKKRPYTNYEVTETIPYDTKTMRPKPQRPVYPLPPPCPGAPPPTFPPPDPPSTMKPPPPPHPTFPPPPPVPTFPQFPKVFPDSPVFSEHDFLESYFPTSFMSTASSFPRMSGGLPGRRNYRAHLPKRYTQDGDESHRITRVARPRTVVRYHKPASVIIRKVHHSSSPETVILRKRNGPVKQVREVHIHHHHDRHPSPVVHIHRDDGEGVDTGRLKANGPSQRLRSSTTGPFAEPPTDLRAGKRVAAKA